MYKVDPSRMDLALEFKAQPFGRHSAELLEENLGVKAIIDRQPMQPGDVPITFADISKAKRLLSYDPTTKIEDGIPNSLSGFEIIRSCVEMTRTGVPSTSAARTNWVHAYLTPAKNFSHDGK